MPIHLSRLSARDEMFSYVPKEGESLHFATTRLLRYLKTSSLPVVNVELDAALAEHVARRNGVEPGHLTESLKRIEEPCVLIEYIDGTHIVVDGNHRIFARQLLEFTFAPAWILPEKVWRRFLIEGVPETPEEAARLRNKYPHFHRWFSQRNKA